MPVVAAHVAGDVAVAVGATWLVMVTLNVWVLAHNPEVGVNT